MVADRSTYFYGNDIVKTCSGKSRRGKIGCRNMKMASKMYRLLIRKGKTRSRDLWRYAMSEASDPKMRKHYWKVRTHSKRKK